MNIDEYSRLIKDEFFYLFEEYGFQIVYIHESRIRFSVFRIGLQSDLCRILFVREQGAGVSFLGALNAPFENEMDEGWVSLIGLLSYILKTEFDWSFLNAVPHNQRIRSSMAFSSNQVRPHCHQLIEMFNPGEKVKKWKPAYKQYVKNMRHHHS